MRKKPTTIIGPDGELLTPDQNIDFAEYTEFVQERGSNAMWDAPRKEHRPRSIRYWAIVLVAVIGGLTLINQTGGRPDTTTEDSWHLETSATPLPYLDSRHITFSTEFSMTIEHSAKIESVTVSGWESLQQTAKSSSDRDFLPASHSHHPRLYAPSRIKSSMLKQPLK